MSQILLGKIALVTGASRGIGRAVAKRLSKDGATVIAHFGKSHQEAESLSAEIRAAGGVIELVQADLAVNGGASALFTGVDAALKKLDHSKFDILINNAGVADWTPWTEMSEAAFDAQFAVNVRALFFASREAMPRLNDGGRIVNVSSIVADIAFPDVMTYSATKGAVNTLTINLAQHLGARNITVNAVSPGATRTDMSAWLNDPAGAENAKSLQALKRIGEVDDIADVVAFYAGPDSRWITGQITHVSGGWKL
jgi:3-oxoacyl-[acyl-carrier protein] reductase